MNNFKESPKSLEERALELRSEYKRKYRKKENNKRYWERKALAEINEDNTGDIDIKTLEERAVELRRAYHREYRKNNKDKFREAEKRYWERKALAEITGGK